MYNRIRNGWTLRRVLFLSIGLLLIGVSYSENQMIGYIIGGYYTLMGVLGFGCAAGNCYTNMSVNPTEMHHHDDTEYEEIKINKHG